MAFQNNYNFFIILSKMFGYLCMLRKVRFITTIALKTTRNEYTYKHHRCWLPLSGELSYKKYCFTVFSRATVIHIRWYQRFVFMIIRAYWQLDTASWHKNILHHSYSRNLRGAFTRNNFICTDDLCSLPR